MTRFAAGMLVLLIFLVPIQARGDTEHIAISAEPIDQFSTLEPDRKRFDRLRFIGGLVLTSPDPRFGGLSGFRFLDGDHSAFIAITDRGHWITGSLIRDAGRPAAITNSRIGPIPGRNGEPLSGKTDADAEGIVRTPYGLIISFERNHRITGYKLLDGNLVFDPRTTPVDLKTFSLPANKGVEALAIIPGNAPHGGKLFFAAEHAIDANGNHSAGLITSAQIQSTFAIAVHKAFSITDAASLPDGGLVLLERFYTPISGVAVHVREIDPGSIGPNAVIKGETLIEADNTKQIDNMEGIDAWARPDGTTVLTIVSDNNFSSSQRTLLLEFEIAD